MASAFHLLYPADYDKEKDTAFKDFSFIRSLQIDRMVVLIKESFRGFTDLSLENYFSTDTRVLEYRLQIVEDLLNNRELYDVFCKSVGIIFNLHDLRRALSSDFTKESALGSIRHLEMYQEIVNLFAGALNKAELHSEGLKQFKAHIDAITDSDDFKNLNTELAKMEMHFGDVKSVTIGVNLDENLRPKEAGIVSINNTPYHAGTIIDRLLKKKSENNFSLMSPFYPLVKGLHGEELKAMNYALSDSLHTVFAKSMRDFEPLIQNFYSENTIVSNTVAFDEAGRFYLVTGPNHGGKSIFAYSVGMAQALFQLGLFVPADSAYMSPVSGIYTHFPSSDENNYGKGRLESECARLGDIMKNLTDTDMLLMDESFSSTSGLEAGYIASEVLTGIGVIGCCGIFVTHIHDLPQQVAQYNSHPSNRGKIDNLVALMENKEDGTRSYKIARTTPDGLSYAKDIASRYGLNLEGILAKQE